MGIILYSLLCGDVNQTWVTVTLAEVNLNLFYNNFNNCLDNLYVVNDDILETKEIINQITKETDCEIFILDSIT